MDTLFLICAVAGGTIVVLQTVLLVLGGGVDSDIDMAGDVDVADATTVSDMADAHEGFLKFLSFKAVVAFLAFFGLGGLAARQAGMSPTASILLAAVCGCLAIYVVAWIMAGLAKLQSKGNLRLKNAVGAVATVYLRVPPNAEGLGRVTVVLQGRTHECKALTRGPELATGRSVRIVGIAQGGVLEVASTSDEVAART